MEATANVIGNNIKALRVRMALTQQLLADYLGVKREVVAYYEGGNRTPNIGQLTKLADLFGVDLYDLMEDQLEAQVVNAAFAFRAGEVNDKHLESIASFRRIVKNYLKMAEAEKKIYA